MADWRDRLRQAMEEAGFSMKRLSLKAGRGESFVRDLVNRDRTPSIENLKAIADALGVSPNWLLSGDDQLRLKVPVVGFASAGEGWTPFDDAQLGAVEFELDAPEYIAIEVRGDSMSPVFRDGDTLFCRRRLGAHVDNYIGLECVLRTSNAEHFVKILTRGGKPGTFNLRSYNPHFRDIEDVTLEWAAPIVWIKRRGS